MTSALENHRASARGRLSRGKLIEEVHASEFIIDVCAWHLGSVCSSSAAHHEVRGVWLRPATSCSETSGSA